MLLWRRHSWDSSQRLSPPPARPLSNWPQWPFFLFRHSIPRDKIQLGDKIGEGAFGWVLKAQVNGRDVVAKFLRVAKDDSSLDKKKKEKLRAEAAQLAQKRHENVVAFKGISNRLGCLVTEFCENRSLYDVMRDKRHQHLFENFMYRVQWLEEIAAAMTCLHHEPPSLIHRDLKPSNIFLDKHWVAKVGDFGLARIVDVLDDFASAWKQSDESNLMLLYQPPEVIAGSMANPRISRYSRKSDVYSYGIIILELLTLEPHFGIKEGPYFAERLLSAMLAIKDGRLRPEIPKDRSLLPGNFLPCLEPLVELMYECCDMNPRKRPDFEHIHQRVSRIREELKKEMQPEESPPKWTAKCIIGSVVAVAIAALILFVVLCYLIKDLVRSSGHFRAESIAGCSVLGICLLLSIVFMLSKGQKCLSKHLKEKKKQSSVHSMQSELELDKRLRERTLKEGVLVASTLSPAVSPFAMADRRTWSSHNSLVDKDLRKYSVPNDWLEILNKLVEELPTSSNCHNAKLAREFCLKHLETEQMAEEKWREEFIRYCLASQDVLRTKVWKEYETASQIPCEVTINIPPDFDPFAAGPSSPIDIPKRTGDFRRSMYHEMAERRLATSYGGHPLENSEIEEGRVTGEERSVMHSPAEQDWSSTTVHSLMFHIADGDAEMGNEGSRGFSFSPSTPSTSYLKN